MSAANRATEIKPEGADISAIRHDITGLKDDFKTLVTDAASTGKDAAKKGAQSLAEGAKTAAEQVKAFQETTCNTVRSHPMASVLIAAGIGAIAARLLMFKGGK